jgi:hypothetical protein
MNDTRRVAGRLFAGPRNTNHALLGMWFAINKKSKQKNPEAGGPQGS